MSMQMAKRVSLSRPWGLNRSPYEIEPWLLSPLKIEAAERAGQIDRTQDPHVWSRDARHVAPASNVDCPISMVISALKL